MDFVERGPKESLVDHLLRNAEPLGLSEEQRERLSLAFRLEIGTRAQRQEAGRIGVEIRDQLQADANAVLARAKARGEKVVGYNDAGAKRIRNRDGLQSLVDYKSLTEAEWSLGMAYRLLFETVGQGLRIGQLEPTVRKTGGCGMDAAALQRAYAGVRLSSCDGALQLADPSLRTLRVVRAVAGEGRTIRSLGEGGTAKAANLAALRAGLDVVRCELERIRALRITAR